MAQIAQSILFTGFKELIQCFVDKTALPEKSAAVVASTLSTFFRTDISSRAKCVRNCELITNGTDIITIQREFANLREEEQLHLILFLAIIIPSFIIIFACHLLQTYFACKVDKRQYARAKKLKIWREPKASVAGTAPVLIPGKAIDLTPQQDSKAPGVVPRRIKGANPLPEIPPAVTTKTVVPSNTVLLNTTEQSYYQPLPLE